MALHAIRYGIPLVLLIAGVVVCAAADSMAAAANVLHRMGVEGDRDRDQEDRARAYFDEHGRWPD